MRSGKDSVGSVIIGQTGVPLYRLAKPLYDAQAALGLGKKNRTFLQETAAPIVMADPGHFCRMLDLWRKNNDPQDEKGAVIVDGRFPYEYIYFGAQGFLRVKLEVTRDTQIARGAEADRLDQYSEVALDGLPASAWDIVIPERTHPQEAADAILKKWAEKQNPAFAYYFPPDGSGGTVPPPLPMPPMIPDYGEMERQRVLGTLPMPGSASYVYS